MEKDSVFDSNGNLVFRVDDYSSEAKYKLSLVDAVGNILLAMRRYKVLLFSVELDGRFRKYFEI